jgi:leader peptidase (prepilin peptidase)/N-methyltransferase
MAVAYMGFIGLLIVGTFVDWEHMVIPDGITVGGLILGLGCSLVYPALHGETKAYHSLVSAFKSMLFGSGLILWIAIFAEIIFRKEAMGMGDVKLMGCIGAFLGIEGCVFALFGGSCIGTAYYVPQLLYGRIVRGSIPSNVVPFGPFLSLASVVYLLGANVYVKNYFEQVRMLLEGP